MSIEENVEKVLEEIAAAARAAGREPGEVTLCAATKMNDAQAVRRAIAAGVRICGENRVQELTAKLADNAYAGAQVHFIGHLQTNKVKQVVGKVDLIQSVDSEHLLAAIEKEAGPLPRHPFGGQHRRGGCKVRICGRGYSSACGQN